MNTSKKKFSNADSLKDSKNNLDDSIANNRFNDDEDDDFDAPLDDLGGFDDLDSLDEDDDDY